MTTTPSPNLVLRLSLDLPNDGAHATTGFQILNQSDKAIWVYFANFFQEGDLELAASSKSDPTKVPAAGARTFVLRGSQEAAYLVGLRGGVVVLGKRTLRSFFKVHLLGNDPRLSHDRRVVRPAVDVVVDLNLEAGSLLDPLVTLTVL
jgi:hypothetical protein